MAKGASKMLPHFEMHRQTGLLYYAVDKLRHLCIRHMGSEASLQLDVLRLLYDFRQRMSSSLTPKARTADQNRQLAASCNIAFASLLEVSK
jgi:hypothetical protein